MSYTYTHVHLQPTCARAHNTHILHACEAKREATMSFVYFEIVISTCLTHKPVPYRKFFYLLRPSSLSFSTAVPFLSVPPLLRSALNAQSIFPCTFSRRPLHVRKSVRWLKFDEGNGIMVKKRKEKKNTPVKVRRYRAGIADDRIWIWSTGPLSADWNPIRDSDAGGKIRSEPNCIINVVASLNVIDKFVVGIEYKVSRGD